MKCRKYVKVLTAVHFIYVQVAYILVFIYSIYCVITANFDASTWPVIYDIYVPLDTTTVLGWYTQFFFGNSMEAAYLLTMVLPTSYFISCTIYIRTMCDHVLHELLSMQQSVEQHETEKGSQKLAYNYQEIRMHLRQAVDIHIGIHK